MTTVIKFFGGDLGDITAFYSCNLSQASAPIQQWDEESECWVSTQYQCADASHDTGRMADLCMELIADAIEVSFDDLECEWEVVDGLIEDADTDHEDARDWYGSYGWHIDTENSGSVMHTAVEFDWLDDEDDNNVVAKLMESDEGLTEDEATVIVSKAREIREAGETIESLLSEAVEAYHDGDYSKCVAKLDECESLESQHGDSPASQSLRGQLLDESMAAVLA